VNADYVRPLAEAVEREIADGLSLGPFHRHWLLCNRAPAVVREQLRLSRERPGLRMARQGFMSMDTNDANMGDFGARNNLATELNILQDGSTGASAATAQAVINEFCAIAPNDARPGKTYQIRAGGIYSNTGTPTLIWTPRWGTSPTVATNISLGASATWTTITGTTNLPWVVDFDFDIRTMGIGATQGTGVGFGAVEMGIPVTSSQFIAGLYIGGTTATIDTTGTSGTAGCGLTLNITWSAASASNTLTTKHWLLMSRN
jgi:hypothetical protein